MGGGEGGKVQAFNNELIDEMQIINPVRYWEIRTKGLENPRKNPLCQVTVV